MKGSKFLLIMFALGIIGYFLYGKMWQVVPPAPAPAPVVSYPGEKNVPGFTQPIIESATDMACSENTDCPSKQDNCVTKTFTAQKDTTYHLYSVYYNGDTLTASCRVCASLYEIRPPAPDRPNADTVLVENLVTACPTGGPWGAHPKLKKDHEYFLSACLQKCPNTEKCACGEVREAFAVVSIRDLTDELNAMFK